MIVGVFLCICLLLDDELRITDIAVSLDNADEGIVSAFMRTKLILRISVVVESLLVIALVFITLRGISTRVQQPLQRLRADLRISTRDHEHVIASTGPTEIVDVAVDAEFLRRALVNQIDVSTQMVQALTLEAPATNAIRRALDRERDHVSGVTGYCRPIEGVIAGDWWWAAQRKDGSRVLAIADISGHGVQAGMMAIESRAIVATALASHVPLAEIPYGLARHRWESGMFLTLFLAILEHDAIEYCSAGAPFASLIRPNGIRSLSPTGPVISNLQGEWTSLRLTISDQELLISATDGLVDNMPEDQLLSALQREMLLQQGDPDHMLGALLADVSRTGTTWADDVTVILATAHS